MTGRDGPTTELLAIDDLRVAFPGPGPAAVRSVSLRLGRGEALGVAGQSGSGKSTLALAIIGLVAGNAEIRGSIAYDGQELIGMSEKRMRGIRGAEIAMIFQEVGTALNPVVRVGEQLVRAIRAHSEVSKREAASRAARALSEDMKLHDVERVMRSYPHQLSGGMSQRVMIAMALSCGAKVLLADEPTTALDVSVQAEILELLRETVERRGLGLILISHDLGVLQEVCSRLMVMYAGEVVESGPTSELLTAPRHAYTAGLLKCLPRLYDEEKGFPELEDGTPEATAVSAVGRGG